MAQANDSQGFILKGKKQRLFFALWPDDAQRQRLWASVRSVQPDHSAARWVPAANLHITLAFLGAVDQAVCQYVEQAADRVLVSPFDFTLDHIACRSRMLWAMPAETPEGLKALVAALESELDGCGVEFDRRPYRAHMTLARKLSHVPDNIRFEQVGWWVTRFSLLVSGLASGPQSAGVCYRELRSWSLK